MKVLKAPKETPSFETTCSSCKALLLIEKGDPFETQDDPREGLACGFRCAHCGNNIWIASRDVPADWLIVRR